MQWEAAVTMLFSWRLPVVMHVDERHRLRLSASLVVPPLAPRSSRGERGAQKPSGLAAYLVPESLVLGPSLDSVMLGSCVPLGYEF